MPSDTTDAISPALANELSKLPFQFGPFGVTLTAPNPVDSLPVRKAWHSMFRTIAEAVAQVSAGQQPPSPPGPPLDDGTPLGGFFAALSDSFRADFDDGPGGDDARDLAKANLIAASQKAGMPMYGCGEDGVMQPLGVPASGTAADADGKAPTDATPPRRKRKSAFREWIENPPKTVFLEVIKSVTSSAPAVPITAATVGIGTSEDPDGVWVAGCPAE